MHLSHIISLLAASLPLLKATPVLDHVHAKRDVPYGTIIEHCTEPGTIALTFDDGPYTYTTHVLDLLDQYGVKATFFVVGDNMGRGFIDDASTPWPDVIRRMVSSGHQVASHTWDHADLSTLDTAGRQSEMQKLDTALVNILGMRPQYMRPPYGSCDAACQADLGAWGYHIINYDVDTKDYENDSPDLIYVAENNYAAAVNNGDPTSSSFIVLSHDIHENTADTLVEYEIQMLQQKGYKAVTVGECLGDASSNWYRAAA